MYQSFPHDPYNSFYYTTMNKSSDNCNSIVEEFRARSQTWGGSEVGYRAILEEVSPCQKYTCCYTSLKSTKDSIHLSLTENNTEIIENKPEEQQKENVVKNTSRKNPWGQETYADLIESAINSYPTKMATLQQIYDHTSKNYKYFMNRSDVASSAGWKNSIRHNLSLHDKFLKCPKKNENMKSSLWSINQNSYKRARSNSMDCKKSGLELIAKRKQLKEQKRCAASKANVIDETKRAIFLSSPTMEKCPKSEEYSMWSPSKYDILVEKRSDYVDMDTESKYLLPDISIKASASNRENNLHQDLQRLVMNSMEPIYSYDDENCKNQSSLIPNFQEVAMEYSKFVADLFNDDLK